ncbi:hypothetical protein Tco_1064924, partial [Tanacetum coccineum]
MLIFRVAWSAYIPLILRRGFLCFDLTVIHTKCGIIGDPNLLLDDETPLVERITPTLPDEDRANSHHVEESPTSKQKQDHVDSLLNEPPTSKQNPSTSTQKCSSDHQIFEDMLKNFDRDDLVKLWSLVHERFNSTEPTEDKERELW